MTGAYRTVHKSETMHDWKMLNEILSKVQVDKAATAGGVRAALLEQERGGLQRNHMVRSWVEFRGRKLSALVSTSIFCLLIHVVERLLP